MKTPRRIEIRTPDGVIAAIDEQLAWHCDNPVLLALLRRDYTPERARRDNPPSLAYHPAYLLAILAAHELRAELVAVPPALAPDALPPGALA